MIEIERVEFRKCKTSFAMLFSLMLLLFFFLFHELKT